jgi:hypothetical protein
VSCAGRLLHTATQIPKPFPPQSALFTLVCGSDILDFGNNLRDLFDNIETKKASKHLRIFTIYIPLLFATSIPRILSEESYTPLKKFHCSIPQLATPTSLRARRTGVADSIRQRRCFKKDFYNAGTKISSWVDEYVNIRDIWSGA